MTVVSAGSRQPADVVYYELRAIDQEPGGP